LKGISLSPKGAASTGAGRRGGGKQQVTAWLCGCGWRNCVVTSGAGDASAWSARGLL